MIVLLFIFFLVMRTVPEAIDNNLLYWLLDSVLMLCVTIYIFKKSSKNIAVLFFTVACLISFSYDLLDYLYMFVFNSNSSECMNIIMIISTSIVSYYLVFRNRYKWKRLKSDNYNPKIVQAIYGKPNTFLTLLGAAISLSPKSCVRYSYNGMTVRFKKGYKTPLMTKTVLKDSDIIKNTSISTSDFNKRFEEIKLKKYNIITFNCRMLFKTC